MIREIATLTIDPAQAATFHAAVAQAKPLFLAAPGCRGMALEQVMEDASSYRLIVEWDSLEAHLVDFRASAAFRQWRALAGPFFTAPPLVIHTQPVV